ncbi:MAG: PadR family transcriptional regulator [Acidobacteria bacterium]|nr:PadR family transcriptional regulator [Acidobacteriota bacterium]
MAKSKNDLLQGTLTLLVLQALSREPLHGYGITLFVERASEDLLRVEEGSLYPALHRMEEDGLVKAEWGTTEFNRRARFYALTAAGRKQLAAEKESWRRLTSGVGKVLRFA